MSYFNNNLLKTVFNLVKVLLFILSLFVFKEGLAQAPTISYNTPNVYAFGTTITPLAPINTGGTVPPNIYGQVSTYAGSGLQGATNGTATTASFNHPTRSNFDAAGNLYVSDRDNYLIRMITPAGVVSTYAGSGAQGAINGLAASASFNLPNGIVVDASGNIYTTDAPSNIIRKITPAGIVSTFAGNGNPALVNGIGTLASFYYPYGDAIDAAGNVYIADTFNNAIRKITAIGVVTTIAGNGSAGFTNGNGTTATFNNPNCIFVDGIHNEIYVSDPNNHAIRQIDASGNVTTLAGGTLGSNDGIGTAASFGATGGVTMDIAGVIYVADLGNSLIRKINPATGQVTTLAGTGIAGSVNGIGTAASFNHPNDAVALNGNLYVTDYGNNLIRKIVLTGYTIDKALPAGLTFDPTTGIISGRPMVLWPPTDYTVTAYNTNGSCSTIVNIAVITSGITFNPIPAKTICDADFDPGAKSANPITYTSSNFAVATIVVGKVHIVGAGTTLITVADITGSTKQTLTVTAPAIPVVTITPNYTSICSGTMVTYSATVVSGGVNPLYQWQLNGTNVGTNSATYITTVNQSDIVQCIVTNNDTCPVSGTSNQWTGIIVTPYSIPTISIQSSVSSPVCIGTAITFTAITNNAGLGPVYQWLINGINTGTNTPTFTSTTLTYGDLINCIVTNPGGKCLTTSFATSNIIAVPIIPPPVPTPSVTITTSSSAIAGTPVTFTANALNTQGAILTYQWLVNGVITGTNSSTYTSSTLKNGDAINCIVTINLTCTITSASTQVIAVIIPLPPLAIPNTFTPNNDGINDVWIISNMAYYPNCSVYIYNRYGMLVFQTKGYSVAWDGLFKGQPVPEATYQYIIDPGNGNTKLSGSVTVIR